MVDVDVDELWCFTPSFQSTVTFIYEFIIIFHVVEWEYFYKAGLT